MYPFFLRWENYNSQETTRRRGTASRCGSALSPPSGPALLLVPSPPTECVSVTQRRCEAEGPSGGRRRRRRLHQQHHPCRALGFASSPPGAHHKADPAPLFPPAAPQRSAPRPTSRRPAWPAGEEGGGKTPRCLLARPAHAHFTPSLRVSEPCWDSGHQQLSGEWPQRAAGGVMAGLVRDAGKVGAQLPRRLPGAAGRLRAPAPEAARSGVCGACIPRPSRRKRLLSGAGRARPPPLPESGARRGRLRAQSSALAASCARGALRG